MRIAGALLALVASFVVPSIARGEDSTVSVDRKPSLQTSGLLLFGSTYGASVGVASAAYRNEDGTVATTMLVPIVGSWLTLGSDAFDDDTTITRRLMKAGDVDRCPDLCPGSLVLVPIAIFEYGLLVLDPIAQAAGLVMALAGANRDKPNEAAAVPKARVKVKPTLVGTGPGVALSVTEW